MFIFIGNTIKMLWIWLVEYENTKNETGDARISQISAKIKL